MSEGVHCESLGDHEMGAGMVKQMDIFDFIEKPQPPKSQFEQIFTPIWNPVIHCANCLCQYCANNAEEIWNKVKPEEMGEPCFNCDECREYTGESKHKMMDCEQCKEFVISEYGANYNRRKLKLI